MLGWTTPSPRETILDTRQEPSGAWTIDRGNWPLTGHFAETA
jgi:hypothetical protein